jgi:hypothetical protein
MRRKVLASCVSLVISVCCNAQAPAVATPAPPLALLQQALAALSPNVTTRDITLTGSVHYILGSDDENGTATVKSVVAGASSIDLSLGSGIRHEVKNLTTDPPSGVSSGPDGISHPIPLHNLFSEPSWFSPIAPLSRLTLSPDSVVTYVGLDQVAATSVQHITVSQQYPSSAFQPAIVPHLSQLDFFLDATTSLPVAISFDVHPDDDAGLDIPVRVQFSDYRTINGTQIPFHIQRFVNNGLTLDIQVDNATINTGLSPNSLVAQ